MQPNVNSWPIVIDKTDSGYDNCGEFISKFLYTVGQETWVQLTAWPHASCVSLDTSMKSSMATFLIWEQRW